MALTKTLFIILFVGSTLGFPQEGPSPPSPDEPIPHAPASARQGDPDMENRQDPDIENGPQPDENGDYHFGDMRMNENQFKQYFGTEEEKALARQGTPKTNLRWNKVVPYTFADNVKPEHRTLVKESLKSLNAGLANCLEIREKTDADKDYVIVKGDTNNGACWSKLGMQGGEQPLNLNPNNNCFWRTTIIHEFLHAIGVFHMQQRADRDNYVNIIWENIAPNAKFNFDKLDDALVFDVPYDARSMMHYKSIGHTSINGKATITSKDSSIKDSEIGMADQLRKGDIMLVRKMYGCDMDFTTPPPPPCKDQRAGCPGWAANGDCKKNVVWMKEFCYQSCEYCPLPCENKNGNCDLWAGWGECKKNPGWMKANCRKACKYC